MGGNEQPTQEICIRCHVAGQVQGVFFRASTRQQAERLGVKGHAKNLADGRVEVLACGPPAAVRELQEWLRQGPPMAKVTGVATSSEVFRQLNGFTVG